MVEAEVSNVNSEAEKLIPYSRSSLALYLTTRLFWKRIRPTDVVDLMVSVMLRFNYWILLSLSKAFILWQYYIYHISTKMLDEKIAS